MNFVIGLRVRQAREAAGLTQEKLAELVDRTKEAISNIERGVNYPAIDTLQRISNAVGMPMGYLLAESSGSRSLDELKAIIDTKIRDMNDADLRFIVSMIDGLTTYKHGK
ncbi:helix-turn-helix domain-containing protein [Methylobacterium sp. J-088]|uniref:helix-turn-helix domain-containing protein n=1 Tax=Methylobacterium sp. J-088 TaxID=2836664 RepID=UPI001FB9B139|nr:helix-turn-helix transcriptional regulator [Methylobacterium sp. J-088]